MTGDAATSTGPRTKKLFVAIVPQREAKVNIEEIIEDLRNQMQTLEDLKTQMSEAQENIRESISTLQMIRVDMGDE